jgi:protein-S-isoprenylcysteine O-methyltransferase Ste14
MKKRLMPDDLFIASLALEVLSHYTFPVVKVFSFPYSLAGIALFLSGILLTLWANYNLLNKKTPVMPFEAPSALISSGPYALSRNPIYLGMSIALFGAAVFLGSLTPYIFPAVFMKAIDSLFIPREEKDLEKTFRSRYTDYKKKVRRWI